MSPGGIKTPFDICEKDPLQFCGNIQSFAGLLVMDPATWELTHISENFQSPGGDQPHTQTAPAAGQEPLGEGIPRETPFQWLRNEHGFFDRWVKPSVLERLRGVAVGQSVFFPMLVDKAALTLDVNLVVKAPDRSGTEGKEQVYQESSVFQPGSKQIYDILVHHRALPEPSEGCSEEPRTQLFLEWFIHVPKKPALRPRWSQFRGLDETKAMQHLLEEIYQTIPFGRGMVYQFESDGSGTVVAEKLVSPEKPLESYLGLRYPATDIPRIVRNLYLKNPLRHIADAQAQGVPVWGLKNPSAKVVLDLSSCVSRGVSPFHVHYLKNMGVPSSTSFAIIFQDKLWGLVSLHRFQDKMIPYAHLEKVLELVTIFTNHLKTCEIHYQMSFWDQARLELDEWIKNLASPSCDVTKVLNNSITDYFGSSEFAFFDGFDWKKFGTEVSDQSLYDCCQQLKIKTNHGILDTDCLSLAYPECGAFFSDYAGISLMWCTDQTHRLDYFLVFLKKELKKIVTWGSQTHFPTPNNNTLENVDFSQVSPIHSFGRWRKIVDHHSEPWSRESRFLSRSMIATMVRCLP